MIGDLSCIAWPSASTLVDRAERSLNIVRPAAHTQAGGSSSALQILADMETRLLRLEQGYSALVPTGFETAGRFAFMKRFVKKVTRRLVWWYVEPRWTVQREITADLASFARSSIQVSRTMSRELQELQSTIAELQRNQRGRAT